MQVKICGLTRPEDAQLISQLGVDAVGLVFWSGSRRAVDVGLAQEICAELAPFVTTTALLVNPSDAEVERLLSQVPINLLQWHGDETPGQCERWQLPYIRALKAQPGSDLVAEANRYPKARGFLLDSVHEGQFGGTGKAFDWDLIPESFNRSIVLAGGLNPANVAGAIRAVRPAAVDVSSGVESAPGIKDHDKIRRFMRAVASVDEDTRS